jgi:hypothetical protein
VASGDTGPATCLDVILKDVSGSEETFGLTVNGLSSTPWNVSVGGTDFYYSDYATGGASITGLWNQTNDNNQGSLKGPLPEQPWDDALGLNIVPYIKVLDGGSFIESGPVPSVAGGGGSSNCSQVTPFSATTLPSCIAGYPKPIWQQGTGVPNDGVRDLPDVSLFAANGPNLSAWPICAEAGDCAAGATSFITLVGGTSTSTPAMAGIMALVNQKYGRQGQADYTLYALASQQSGVFHDITIGTNDVLCQISNPGSVPIPNCTTLYSNPYFSNLYSFGVYAAGTGYDLATGLGSFDANELISNWTKVALLPTTTLLQLSPTTVTHGSPISLTASVTPSSSGAVVPTGEIVLETNPVSAMRGNQAIALASGTASASVTTLPGGSYQVLAQYGGDGVYGASASTPVAVTITPEPSVTALTYKGGGVLFGPVPFGSGLTYEATPTGKNTNSSGLATGSATFTDGNTSATVPLNVNGVATWSPQALALGSHSVTVSYSGDASYAPSTGGPLTFTVVPGTPALAVEVLDEPPTVCTAGGTCSINFVAGSNLVVHVVLRALNANVPPTGTVTVSLGALTQTVPVVAESYINEGLSTAYATLPNVPAGTYSLSASYSGDSNWNATTYTYSQQLTFVANSAVASTTTALTASSTTVNSSGSVTFTATVTASTDQYGTPFGPVFLLGNGTLFAEGFAGPPGGGIITASPTETATITVPANSLPLGQLSVIAVYAGGFGVASSISAPVQLNVTATDFTFSTGAASLTVKSGQTATVPLLLGGPYGIGVPVSLACAPSSSLFTCSVNPASATVTGSGAATLTITAYVPATTTKLSPIPGHSRRWFAATFSFAFAFGAVLIFPSGRRKWRMPAIFLLFAFLFVAPGCGGGSNSAPPPPNSNPTPPGAYSVVVTATANGIVHNAQLPVLVSAP